MRSRWSDTPRRRARRVGSRAAGCCGRSRPAPPLPRRRAGGVRRGRDAGGGAEGAHDDGDGALHAAGEQRAVGPGAVRPLQPRGGARAQDPAGQRGGRRAGRAVDQVPGHLRRGGPAGRHPAEGDLGLRDVLEGRDEVAGRLLQGRQGLQGGRPAAALPGQLPVQGAALRHRAGGEHHRRLLQQGAVQAERARPRAAARDVRPVPGVRAQDDQGGPDADRVVLGVRSLRVRDARVRLLVAVPAHAALRGRLLEPGQDRGRAQHAGARRDAFALPGPDSQGPQHGPQWRGRGAEHRRGPDGEDGDVGAGDVGHPAHPRASARPAVRRLPVAQEGEPGARPAGGLERDEQGVQGARRGLGVHEVVEHPREPGGVVRSTRAATRRRARAPTAGRRSATTPSGSPC